MARPTARAGIEALLHPRAIAVVGATERLQYGGRLVANLLKSGYAGQIVPVNPNRSTVMGLPCYPTISDAPCFVDMAAIVIPAPAVPAALAECADLEVPSALVISAGFAEADSADGLELQERVAAAIELAGPRVCGPNCLGVATLADAMWASANVLAPIDDRLLTGGIAVISQSGATAFGPLLAVARDRGIGLRYVVSTGNEVDLTTADFIDYMVADRGVTAIACVLEGIQDGPAFRTAVEAALAADKPLVVLKLGRSEVGAAAARSHTAALTGRDDVFEAMVRQYGLARADDWDELLEMARTLSVPRRPRGAAVGVVSHSGGIGGVVADHCNALGLAVPPLGKAAEGALATVLAGRGAARNPADVTGHYAQETFTPILDALVGDPGLDALAVATAGDEAVAARIVAAAERTDKPVVVCWTGGLEETAGLCALRASELPVLHEPRHCARALAALWSWTEARTRLEEPTARCRDPEAWARVTALVAETGGSADPWPEQISLGLIERAGVPIARMLALPSGALGPNATAAALGSRFRSVGLRYPLVAKIDSPDLPHKSDVGGVELGIVDDAGLAAAIARIDARVSASRPDARRRGFLLQEQAPKGVEVAIGFQHDEQLGPVVMLTLGGDRVEAIGQPSWRLLPLRRSDAEAMIGEVANPRPGGLTATAARRREEEPAPSFATSPSSAAALRGLERLLASYRGAPPADRGALVEAILAFAGWCWEMAAEVESAELNPVIVLPIGEGVRAVDALILPRSDRD